MTLRKFLSKIDQETILVAAVIWHWKNTGKIVRMCIELLVCSHRKFHDLELEDFTNFCFSNGEEWWKIRSELQKGLSSPKNVRNFLSEAEATVKDFVEFLPKRFDENGEIKETLEELSRVYLELTCQIAFDERLNSFSEEERLPSSRSSRLIKAAEDTNHSILPTDQGFPFWKLFETREYKKLQKSQEFMEKVAVELVAKKINQPGDKNSLLDQYLKNPKLDVKDIHGMAADLLLAGVHTTSFTTAFALYYISNDQRVQDLLFDEALRVLPSINDDITPTVMNSEIPYTRAVLKETFRLNPISIGVGRISNNDMVLGGYHVPKDVSF
jgi:ecdysteroid 22-hydroxylase